MIAAIRNNSCPYCDNPIMPSLKAEQYLNLVNVLNQTAFTNRLDVDEQIREKVTSLLMDNFVFKKLESVDPVADIIVIHDEEPTTPASLQGATSASPIPVLSPLQSSPIKITPAKVVSQPKEEEFIPPEETKSAAPRALTRKTSTNESSPVVAQKALSASDYMRAQDESFDDASPDVDADLDSFSPDELMKIFPDLTPNDLSSMRQSKGVSTDSNSKGIRRLNQ